MTPEGKVKKEVRAFLDSLGTNCWYYMPVPMGYGKRGVPDIIGCYKGQFFSIECKAPGKLGNVTPWQLKEAIAIRQAGGSTCLLDTAQHMDTWLKHLIKDYML